MKRQKKRISSAKRAFSVFRQRTERRKILKVRFLLACEDTDRPTNRREGGGNGEFVSTISTCAPDGTESSSLSMSESSGLRQVSEKRLGMRMSLQGCPLLSLVCV